MSDSLHVLLIDDNPDDRALVIRELRREFPDLHDQEVTDPRGFEGALSNNQFDLVITDYQLGWSDGLNILRRVKARWPDCPVLMFTGTGSEEIAVEAMKAGLDDYVLKSPIHYSRLASAARLALKVAQQKLQLRQAEDRYSVLFQTVPVGLYRATAEGRILEANPAFVEMLRFPDQAAVLASDMAGLFLSRPEYDTWQRLVQTDGVVHRFEARLRTFDGGECWVENSARAVNEPGGKGLIYEGSLESIHERKQAEDERERLIVELQEALAQVKTLSGLLPICAVCKKIRDNQGSWSPVEVYIQSHSDAEFTHSFCPECLQRLYPDVVENAGSKG